ncbi:MAG: glutamate-1-semialdehyde 2,1-aminomutase [Phycisphaerae bacterium]|nr:glutamate-1-semialdehyde 2,1-aminomutase [Phycisphaerae bacterium]
MTRTNEGWHERGKQSLPGGVSSPVRAFAAVGGVPRVIRSARGAFLRDVSGRDYIDYIGGWGAAIHGHGHPKILRAVRRAARRGLTFGTAARGDVRLAERIRRRMPSIELVRFTNSGTEAVMTAIRIARAATGRSWIVKCDGCYHGHADGVLVKAGSGGATFGVPDSIGVPNEIASQTLVIPYNDSSALEACLVAHRDRIAAVIVEPVAGNMGVVPPHEGYLSDVARIARAHGVLLLFDEVMTGFRVARGGAQERYGVAPDLTVLGKIIGGGLPVGAVGGPAALMQLLAPLGSVYQGGTFAGNPVVMASGEASLKILSRDAYRDLEARAGELEAGLKDAIRSVGVQACVQRVGSMLTLFFGIDRATSMAEVRNADARLYARFFHAMLDRGCHLPPSAFEAWFLSMAHRPQQIELTIKAARAALRGCSA